MTNIVLTSEVPIEDYIELALLLHEIDNENVKLYYTCNKYEKVLKQINKIINYFVKDLDRKISYKDLIKIKELVEEILK